MTIWIAIDPGVSGAICALNDEGLLRIIDTPVEVRKAGKKNKSHYLVSDMVKIFDDLLTWDECCGIPMGDVKVVIEAVHSMPRDGVVQAFSLGYGLGLWVGICHARGIDPIMVPPQVWKKKLQLNGEKEDSRAKALQLYKYAHDFIKLKKHHNRAEALLLAHYGKNYV